MRPLLTRRLHQRASASAADESDDFFDQWVAGKFLSNRIDSIGNAPVTEEQRPIGAAQSMQLRTRDAAALQADDVQPNQGAGLA
jgi:hypothetical protein